MNKTPKIKVVGIGGSGVNAISRMFRQKIAGVELVAVNTDAQSLRICPPTKKILIGEKTTKGFGAGMDFRLGERAARESQESVKEALSGAEMVFLTCGLGGGTGSGGIHILGEVAKSLGALTVAVVTLPFSFEGSQRKGVANWALRNLEGKVDTLLIVPNDKLLGLVSSNTTLQRAFWMCDGILREGVAGISDLVSLPGIINVDFVDLRGILKNSKKAFLGIGRAKGEKRAILAANLALHSPLLDFSIKDSQGILLNIAGGEDLALSEVHSAATFIRKNSPSSTKMIFGVSEDPTLQTGELKITMIATSKN